MGAASDTMVFAPGAVQSERLYRAFAEFCGLHWVSPWGLFKSFGVGRVSVSRVRSGGRQPIGVKLIIHPSLAFPSGEGGTSLRVTDEESTFPKIYFRRIFLRYPAAHNARGSRIFFITFFACAKKVTKESTPREGSPSGSLLLPRGGGTWLYGSGIRYHGVRARRGSIRTPLPRLCGVLWSPLGLAVGFV